jgi:hypothetical protein
MYMLINFVLWNKTLKLWNNEIMDGIRKIIKITIILPFMEEIHFSKV